jgi:hypothetical protein
MRKNSLTPNQGLSLSTAQSISNLCNQRASEINATLTGVNNYEKTIDIEGKKETKTHVIVVGKKLPENIVALITEKAELHACQAFLMENLKAKEAMLIAVKKAVVDISDIEVPERPAHISPLVKMLPEVNEEWGWSQLSAAEINEFTEAEAFAAHIGQFIHADSPLDKLRKELGKGIAPIEWMIVKDGEKSVVEVKTHHTSEELLGVHEELAALHRTKEQRVNYFKAKVKNLVTEENARIAKHNADVQNETANTNNQLQSTYDTAYKAYSEKVKSVQAEYEQVRQAKIKEIASMRISVDARFQKTIDAFLTKVIDE